MNINSEGILVIIMGIVCGVCVFTTTAKTGVIMFSLRSRFKQARVKYVVKKEKLKQFYNAMATALLLNVFVAVSFTRDFKNIAFFVVFNMLFIGYCLLYWILLEPKPRK
jgi:hypothetical protein